MAAMSRGYLELSTGRPAHAAVAYERAHAVAERLPASEAETESG